LFNGNIVGLKPLFFRAVAGFDFQIERAFGSAAVTGPSLWIASRNAALLEIAGITRL
jgi:hypothetical protein